MQPNDPERTLVLSLNANDDRRMWTDTTVSGPAYYSYQMLAVDSAGNVSKDGVPLEVRVHERMKRDQVLNVRATRMDENVVQVNWKGPAGKVRHYVIYRSKDLGTLMPLGSVPSDTLSYSDIRLAGKGSYTYSVQAVFEDGSGSPDRLRHETGGSSLNALLLSWYCWPFNNRSTSHSTSEVPCESSSSAFCSPHR
jgi:autonomous glycyl radical cofactor GrcA